MTSVDSNFNFLCGRSHGLHPSPVHMRSTETDPLHVDVINEWPLSWSSFRMLGNVRPILLRYVFIVAALIYILVLLQFFCESILWSFYLPWWHLMIFDISLVLVWSVALVFLHFTSLSTFHHAICCEVYEVNEDFLVVFYAFSSICLIVKS